MRGKGLSERHFEQTRLGRGQTTVARTFVSGSKATHRSVASTRPVMWGFVRSYSDPEWSPLDRRRYPVMLVSSQLGLRGVELTGNGPSPIDYSHS